MISKELTHMKKAHAVPVGYAVFRTVKSILQPILILAAVFFALVSLFTPMEGSNSPIIHRCISAGALLLIGAMILANKLVSKNRPAFQTFTPKVDVEIQPGAMLVMLLLTVVILAPLYVAVITSLKTAPEANAVDFTWYVSQGVTFENYTTLFEYGDITGIYMSRAFLNSLLLAIFPPLISLLISAASAFMFCQGRFRGKQGLYDSLLYTMVLPGFVTMASSIVFWDMLNLMGTPVPMFAGCIFGSAGTVMYLREYMTSMAQSVFESAEMDGAGRFRQYFSMVLPICRPALTGQFILAFIGGFNEYMNALIYIHDPQWYTVQIALAFLQTGNLDTTILASGAVVVMVPMIAIYLMFQKYIINGVQMSSGVKG